MDLNLTSSPTIQPDFGELISEDKEGILNTIYFCLDSKEDKCYTVPMESNDTQKVPSPEILQLMK